MLFSNTPPLDVAPTGSPPRSDLWKALFDSTTYVRPFEFQRLDLRSIRSYPVRHIQSFLRDRYVRFAATAGTDYPPAADLLGPEAFGPIGFPNFPRPQTGLTAFPDPEATLTQQLEDTLRKQKTIPPAGEAQPAKDYLQLKRFHQPRNAPLPRVAHEPLAYARPAVEVPKLDFHQVQTSLGNYPQILRRLGLVFDLLIPLGPNTPPSAGQVQVIASWTPAIPNGAGFQTKNVFPKTRYGFSKETFTAAPRSVDPDLKNGMLMLSDPKKYEVVQLDTDGAAIKALDFAANLIRTQTPQFTSDDTPENHSVPSLRSGGIAVARVGRATNLHAALLTAKQHDANAAANQDVVLDAEDLMRGYCVDVWHSDTGRWHPLCRRVGTYDFLTAGETLVVEDEGWVTTAASSAADGSSDDLFLQEQLFRWRGWSLVAPRPGLAIDKDGDPKDISNTPPADFQLKTDFKAAPGSLPRLRYGDAYALRARAVDLAGNSTPFGDPGSNDFSLAAGPVVFGRFEPVVNPTLVRRSPRIEGDSMERMVIRSNFNTPAANADDRHVAPPKIDQLTAEMDARFDSPGGVDNAAYALIVAREAGGYDVGGVLDPNNNNTPYFDLDSLPLPYLPDPLARGAAFRGLLGLPAGVPFAVPFIDPGGVNWPDAQTFRLQVVEGDPGGAAFDSTSRVLKVALPKAEIVKVRYNCYLSLDDLAKLGLWEWLKADPNVSAAQINLLQAQAVKGSHWMFTPFRELLLVHAVQQPLLAPEFSPGFGAQKGLGQTFARLSDKLPISGKSTSKVNVVGEWTEPIDALGESKWKTVPGKAEAFEIPVAYTDTVLPIRHSHEFGDTKHRFVDYKAVATTRFEEYFPDGTTPVTRESAAPRRLNILNSARPESPKVLYVLPTFGWTGKATADVVTSTRRGGGLRVYMDRPWWSSGEGELLGVVIWPRPRVRVSRGIVALKPPEVPNALQTLVTQWGMDPIWTSQPLDVDTPSTAHFTRAVATQSGVTLDELPGTSVAVAGHEVGYDEDRKLWYCDIDIDVGDAYYPFIRLALARYQPDSVKDAYVSRVVLADFAQVAPDRTVSVAFSLNPTQLIVTLAKPGYERSAGIREGAVVEVTVEQRRTDVSGDLGWVPVPNGTFALEIPTRRRGATQVWTGEVELPEPRGSRPFRLVIREYERHLFMETDNAPSSQVVRRLVYADVLEI